MDMLSSTCSSRNEPDLKADYVRFLEISYGSVCEVEYQLSLAQRLSYLDEQRATKVISIANETGRVLNGLLRSLNPDP